MEDIVAGASGDEGTRDEAAVAEAPTPRAKALREEIFGSALSLDEVAYILSLDRTTVAKYLREKTIVGFQIGREWLVPEEELRAYVGRMAEQRRQEAWQSVVPPPPFAKSKDPGAEWPGWDLMRLLGGRGGKGAARGAKRFDRFTHRARIVLTLAQEEAVRINHNYIGTEHLLLGLVAEGQGVAAQVLAGMGVELDAVRRAVVSVIGRGNPGPAEPVGLTPRSKKVIELAVDEARHLGHTFVGTEHLLLGLVREGEGIAAGVLESLGLNLERVRAETVRLLERSTTEDTPDAAQTAPCPRCGAGNPGSYRFCPRCGAPTSAGEGE